MLKCFNYKLHFIITCSLFLFLFSQHLNAQSVSEVVVQAPAVTAKNYDTVKQEISLLQGVQIMKYCSSENLFLLKVDRTIQADDTSIETVFKNLGLEFYFKQGGFAAALSNCKDNDSLGNPDQVSPQ